MNYYEWSLEYYNTAKSIENVIERLKKKRACSDVVGKKELDIKLAKYKVYYNECMQIANHLKLRYEGVE